MTFDEWRKDCNIGDKDYQFTDTGGCRVVFIGKDNLQDAGYRIGLWFLTDYKVSSANDAGIWLRPIQHREIKAQC